MTDRRERDFTPWFVFDPKRMTLAFTVEGVEVTVTVPACYEVCGTCAGTGSHVNPSIDSHGLSAEDFDADPDFREDYMTGAYDVPCYECKGNRVTPWIDTGRATEAQCAAFDQRHESECECRALEAAERRMGY